jgi:serine/threonine-protein kinase
MPQITRTIGRYVVERVLGQGAMGVVYLAEDPLLKRRVAIKVVRAEGEERDHALERFRREAEISAQLNHPNIVTIYDVGEEPGFGPFIAMEYVEGASLSSFIRDGNLDLETRFGILIQAMRALRTAHRHAIIHRDVKPENILVAEDGRVKLMDFGIAKTMAPQITNAGEFLGSPAYSAPELLRGQPPTPSSDRYAYAVTAFELLTGQLPHPGTTVAAVITHVLMEAPVIPPGVAPEVAKVFREALAADPDDRPDTLMDFLIPLMEAHPLEPPARERVLEMFRHDDYAGDIVPLRRLKPPTSAALEAMESAVDLLGNRPGPARSTGGRSTAGRSTDGLSATGRHPLYAQPPAVKIELSEERPVSQRPPSHHRRLGREHDTTPSPLTLLKWLIIAIVASQATWWLVRAIHASQQGH